MMTVNKFFRTYKELTISLLMILLSVLGLIFGIVPSVKKIIDIRNNSVALVKTIQILRTKINILESKDESTYRDQLSQLVAAVPGDKSLPTVFATLDGLSAQSGVLLTDFTLSKLGSIASESATRQSSEERQLGSNLLSFSITVSGSYDQVYTFLSLVNNVRRFFRVNNFNISYEDTSGISVHMGMDAFYSPISSAVGAVDSPLDPLSAKEEDLITKISQMPYLAQSALLQTPAAQLPSTPRSTLFSP